jgi:phage gp45-like
MTPADIGRFLAPIQRRMMLAIGRAMLRGVSDAGGVQTLQVSLLAGETRDAVERVQQFGLSSVPMPGADVVVVSVGGNRDHPVAIAVDDQRFRPTGLAGGEVCLYSRRPGQRITLLADGTVLVQGTTLRIEADVEIVGAVTATGDITSGTISLQTHRHGAVTVGAGVSGVAQP